MKKPRSLSVGRNRVTVSNELYNAAKRDTERVRKKKYRLRKDGLNYEEKSLNEMYASTEFEPSSGDDVALEAVNNILAKQIFAC